VLRNTKKLLTESRKKMIAYVRECGDFTTSPECGSDETLDLQHHMFTLTFGGKLYAAPIPKDQQLQCVLDVGNRYWDLGDRFW